jgi:ABC-2 type transport system ATP-binding protein
VSGAMVEVRDLRQSFGGLEAVRGVSFAIERGRVLGFIGANGAGKTTTMRMMATLDAPTGGSVRIAGHDVLTEPKAVREKVGWMPDSYGAYPHVSVAEYLDYFARAYGFQGAERRRRIGEIMEFTDLASLGGRAMATLSKGMAQRLCLGRALLNDPEVLLLDEPAAGLDPRARIEFKRLVRLLAADGKTIFISSHILSELEEMCDGMLFIDAGRIVHDGSAESLKSLGQADGAVITVEVAGDPATLETWVLTHPGVRLVEPVKGGFRIRFESVEPESIAGTLGRMVRDGVPVVEFRREARKLEDAFIEFLGKIEKPGADGGGEG